MSDKQTIEAVGVFLKFEDTFLVLRRHPDDPQGDQWGLVGGKVEVGEDPVESVVREVHEEINLQINESNVQFIEKFGLDYPEYEVDFYVYGYELDKEIRPVLSENESYDFEWVSYDDSVKKRGLMSGLYLILRSEKVKRFLEL